MTGNYHFGDSVTQHGDHNVGMVKHQAPSDPRTALRDMVGTIHALREHVPPADRSAIDECLHTIESADAAADPHRLRRALANVAGIAAMVGQVGAPAIEAVRKVMAAFGL